MEDYEIEQHDRDLARRMRRNYEELEALNQSAYEELQEEIRQINIRVSKLEQAIRLLAQNNKELADYLVEQSKKEEESE